MQCYFINKFHQRRSNKLIFEVLSLALILMSSQQLNTDIDILLSERQPSPRATYQLVLTRITFLRLSNRLSLFLLLACSFLSPFRCWIGFVWDRLLARSIELAWRSRVSNEGSNLSSSSGALPIAAACPWCLWLRDSSRQCRFGASPISPHNRLPCLLVVITWKQQNQTSKWALTISWRKSKFLGCLPLHCLPFDFL